MNKLKKMALTRIVHGICGKKGLALTDEQRHAIQKDVIGKESLSDMTAYELETLISHLRKIQKSSQAAPAAAPAPKPRSEWAFVFRLPEDRQRFARKIFRLAETIGAMQKPPVPVMSKAYVEGIAGQMRGCEQPLEFCDAEQLHKIVQALEIHIKRHGG